MTKNQGPCNIVFCFNICIHLLIYIYPWVLRFSGTYWGGVGGVGWGWWHSLHLHTCEMLRNWWHVFPIKRVLKKPATNNIFRGRHIVFKLRPFDGQVSTKKYSVLPLPPKIAHEGHVLKSQQVCSTSVFFCTISLLPSCSNWCAHGFVWQSCLFLSDVQYPLI